MSENKNFQLTTLFKFWITGIIIFFISSYAAFWFENDYEKLIRNLFEMLTNHNISFYHPYKYFKLASAEFVLSFGGFTSVLIFLLRNQSMKRIFRNLIAAMFAFAISTSLFCYIDGTMKLITCTICNDGKLMLHYGALNYDLVFTMSLIASIIPAVITYLRSRNTETNINYSSMK